MENFWLIIHFSILKIAVCAYNGNIADVSYGLQPEPRSQVMSTDPGVCL
jgi:hypothetical protein